MKLDRKIYKYQHMMDLKEVAGTWPGCDCDDCLADRDKALKEIKVVVEARGGDDMSWRRSSPSGAFFGIELELEAPRTKTRESIVRAFPEPVEGDHFMPVFERDFSLTNGVEVIFPPIKADTIRDPSSYIRRAMDAVRESGTSEESSSAGMHINVNTYRWSNHAKLVFCAVIHSMPNEKLSAIGGRLLNNYCRTYKTAGVINTSLERVGTLAGHAWAAEMHENRIECRYPVAKVDPTHLIKNITFIEQVSKFAKSRSQKVLGITEHAKAWGVFSEWLANQENADAVSIREALA